GADAVPGVPADGTGEDEASAEEGARAGAEGVCWPASAEPAGAVAEGIERPQPASTATRSAVTPASSGVRPANVGRRRRGSSLRLGSRRARRRSLSILVLRVQALLQCACR